MRKIVKYVGLMAASLGLMIGNSGCNPEPDATDLEFSYSTFTTDEGAEEDYVSVYLMETPEKFPVVVDMTVELVTGKNDKGEELVLDDVLEFITTDQTYTVTKINDTKAEIKGVEVTYTEYNKKVYFTSKDNDYLQEETITLLFTLTKVEGSNMGSMTTTTLTIVDDEKAPLVKVGYYDTRYTAPTDATREGKGQFYLRLQKVGKYDYVASELFGLPRPRLLGTFNPETNTIVFDGTDFDHTLWAEATAEDDEPFVPVNAFQNDTIWANNLNAEGVVTEVLKLRGAQVDGKEAIVMTTQKIEENASGVVLSIDTPCGFDIYNFHNGKAGALVGIYDAMEQSESMTFGTTNYPSEVGSTRATTATPTPFGAWRIEDINR